MADSRAVPIPEVDDGDIRWASSLLGLPSTAFFGLDGLDPRQAILKSMAPMDIAACPGSGKTTLLVAKLAILAEKWPHRTRGICVLSHTNAARNEIESRLGNTAVGRRLLTYPHFIGTIHGFVNDFLALPWLRSLGFPIRLIDTDTCLEWRWRALPHKIRLGLEKNGHTPSLLIVRSPDFGVGGVRWGNKGELARTTPTYTAMQDACRRSATEGFFCYDEMFMWATELLRSVTAVQDAIRDRFPVLFIDEAQDNSEDQSSILHRIFMEGGSRVIRQRFGDANQAIFDFLGAKDAKTDPFPSDALKKDIPNSHRFGQRIADLADPLGLAPYGLKGQGPRKKLASGASDGPHTIFLFGDANSSGVLEAYGALLIESFSEQERMCGTFTAVGQVHRPSEAYAPDKFPQHVGHYWASYDPELTGLEPKPRTFVQYLHAGRGKAETTGEVYFAIEPIAEAILRLAGMNGGRSLVVQRHRHRQLLRLLHDNPGARKSYEDFGKTFALERESLLQESWNSHWCGVARRIATVVAGEELHGAQVDAFLKWPDSPTAPDPQQGVHATRDNIYRYPQADPKVAIRVGSIHSVKGQTHTATLVLDTFWQGRKGKHNLELLMPWLLGEEAGGGDEKAYQQTRLKLHYVAMTRPTHLICLALRRSALAGDQGVLNEEMLKKLQSRGWQVKTV